MFLRVFGGFRPVAAFEELAWTLGELAGTVEAAASTVETLA